MDVVIFIGQGCFLASFDLVRATRCVLMADVLMLAMKKPDKEHRRIPAEQRYRDELEEAGLSACCLYLEYEVMLLHLLSYYNKNTAAFIILPNVSSVSSGDIPIARH